MASDNLRVVQVANGHVVSDLRRLLVAAPADLLLFRHALRRALSGEQPAWRDHRDPATGRRHRSPCFHSFIVAAPPAGLGTDAATLRRLLGDHPERAELELALARRPGRPETDDIVMGLPPRAEQGNSTGYAFRRLSSERPDLFGRVKAGGLSPHAAMVQAGFRRVKTPLAWLRHWWRRASEAERTEFLREAAE